MGPYNNGVSVSVTNLSNGVPTESIRAFLLEELLTKASGRFKIVYKGAPKWVIRARIEALVQLINGETV